MVFKNDIRRGHNENNDIFSLATAATLSMGAPAALTQSRVGLRLEKVVVTAQRCE